MILLKFILLTISISSLSTFAKINNFYPYEINKKVKTQIRITKSNAKENLTLKISQLDEILKKDNETLKVIESQIEQSKNILNSKLAAWSPRLSIRSNEIPKYTTGDTRNKLQGESGSNQLKVGIDAKFEWDVINPKRRLEIKIAKDKLENLKNIYLKILDSLYPKLTQTN